MNTESCIKLKKKNIKKQNQYLAVEEKTQTWRLLLFRSGVGGTLISLLISILLVQLTTGCCYGLLCRKSFFFLSLSPQYRPEAKDYISFKTPLLSFSTLLFSSAGRVNPPFLPQKSSVSTLPYPHIPLIIDSLCWHFFFMSLRSSSSETDRKNIFFSL